MQLLLTVDAPDHEPMDTVVEMAGPISVGELADSFATQLDVRRTATLRLGRTGQSFDRDLRVDATGIRSGDRLSLADHVNATVGLSAAGPSAATLVVEEGPAAGQTHLLHHGANDMGRDPGNDVAIADEQASRRHVRITVTDTIVVSDLGSKNGVTVDGLPINTPTAIQPHQRLGLGATVVTVRHNNAGQLESDLQNALGFNRPPRIARPFPGVQVELPAPPDKPQKQRLPMIAAVVPLLMGLMMWFFFGPLGALFMLMSPVMAVGSVVEARRSGRLDHKEAVNDHEEAIADLVRYLERARCDEERSRQLEAPVVGDLSAIVDGLADRLWERAPDDPDFLALRVGTADQPSRSSVKIAAGGARELRERLHEIPGRFAEIADAPLVVGLPTVGAVGVSGPHEPAVELAQSLVLQTAVLHSPDEVVIAALVSEPQRSSWEWLKWLPHTRSDTSPVAHPVASSSHRCLEVLDQLHDLIAERSGDGTELAGPGPAIVLLVDESCPVERRRLAPVLEFGPAAGIHVIWVSSARHRLPKTCGAVVEIDGCSTTARVGLRASGATVEPVAWEGVLRSQAELIARSLAPVVDISGRGGQEADVPRTVSLVDLLGDAILDEPDAALELWSENVIGTGEGYPLRAVIGRQAGAPLTVDIRQDGPHALVAGTTGAGKSELLQSLVASLAAMHSPERVTFLLVDYKGGAAFKECVHFPHTVGLVTDLNQNEVRRALVSLNAELHHRELILQRAGAKDLMEMERRGLPETPPSLLVIVDEFAALAKEVPEFVEGVVDVALRGRSLGLHLVLATQRPAGVITPQIRANTNLRIALRVATPEDSDDVLASPVAASIDRRLPGRAVARIGPQELVRFQSAYVGGHTVDDLGGPEITLSRLGFEETVLLQRATAPALAADHPTDLERMVTNLAKARAETGFSDPRRPWLAPLADVYDLDRLPRSRAEGELVFGVVDLPHRQNQALATFDADNDGSLLVFGTSGAGKTGALRTVAVAAARNEGRGSTRVYGLDFAGRGLEVLESMPNVGSVISGDDQERVIRLLRSLRSWIDDRAERFAQVRAQSLSEYRRLDPDRADEFRILVLLDGYSGFHGTYERIQGGMWVDALPRLIADGRQVGVHFVITADRRSSVPMAIAGTVPRSLVLRMASDDEYANAGVAKGILSHESPAGRGILDDLECQVGVLGGSVDGELQATAIERLAQRLRDRGVPEAPPVRALPTELWRTDLQAQPDSIAFGLGDQSLTEVSVPLGQGGILVTGPPRSGKTVTLATISQAASEQGIELHHVHERPSTLAGAPWWGSVARGVDQACDLFRRLRETTITRPSMLVIDDLGEMAESLADAELTDLMRASRDLPLTVVAAVDSAQARRAYGGAVTDLRKDRIGMLLAPDIETDGDIYGVMLPRTTIRVWPEGRGFLVRRGDIELAQVALPDHW